MGRRPKWQQIVDETLGDEETVEIVRRFLSSKEGSKEFLELGTEIQGILDGMCDEWVDLWDYQQEGLMESMRERIETNVREYFWEQIDILEKKREA